MLIRPLRSRQADGLTNESLVDLPLTIKRRARPSVLRPTNPSFTAAWVAASGVSVNNAAAFAKTHPSGRTSGTLLTKNPVSGTFGGARRATDPFKLSDFKLIGLDVLPSILGGSVSIRFSSDNFATKRVEYSWPFPAQLYSDNWNRLTARVLADTSGIDPNGGWTFTGGMTMDETINSIQISISTTANAAATLAIDNVLLFEKTPTKGVVMFGFDRFEDASIPSLALPIAQAQGIRPYAAGDTNKIPNPSANWSSVKQLFDAGWPIFSQGPDHKDYVTAGAAQLTTDVAVSRAALTAAGFTNALDYFAYPFSSNNLATDAALLAAGFKFASTGIGWNGHPNEFNAGYKLIGQGRQNIGGMTLTQVQRLIDRAVQYGVVVDLFCHGLVAGGNGGAAPADPLLWYANDWRDAIIYAKAQGAIVQNPVQFFNERGSMPVVA